MEFTGWVKIKNQHGYYLVVKKDKEPVVGGIITLEPLLLDSPVQIKL
jgi:hypothetical protein